MMPVKCWSSLSCVSRFSRSINLHLSRPPRPTNQHPNQRREHDALHLSWPLRIILRMLGMAMQRVMTTSQPPKNANSLVYDLIAPNASSTTTTPYHTTHPAIAVTSQPVHFISSMTPPLHTPQGYYQSEAHATGIGPKSGRLTRQDIYFGIGEWGRGLVINWS